MGRLTIRYDLKTIPKLPKKKLKRVQKVTFFSFYMITRAISSVRICTQLTEDIFERR